MKRRRQPPSHHRRFRKLISHQPPRAPPPASPSTTSPPSATTVQKRTRGASPHSTTDLVAPEWEEENRSLPSTPPSISSPEIASDKRTDEDVISTTPLSSIYAFPGSAKYYSKESNSENEAYTFRCQELLQEKKTEKIERLHEEPLLIYSDEDEHGIDIITLSPESRSSGPLVQNRASFKSLDHYTLHADGPSFPFLLFRGNFVPLPHQISNAHQIFNVPVIMQGDAYQFICVGTVHMDDLHSFHSFKAFTSDPYYIIGPTFMLENKSKKNEKDSNGILLLHTTLKFNLEDKVGFQGVGNDRVLDLIRSIIKKGIG